MAQTSDRIEKKVRLKAPRERVWRAISQSAEFGKWFGMRIEGQFAPNTTLAARMVPTEVDPAVAATQQQFAGMRFELYVERVEPMSVLSFRWHPYPVELAEAARAPTTLVVFELEDHEDGTLLTVRESGFDQIPVDKRAKAFADNEQGWEIQTQLIGKYLEHAQH
jgi:uncharacterized protein YndB with AHSA1/START domain